MEVLEGKNFTPLEAEFVKKIRAKYGDRIPILNCHEENGDIVINKEESYKNTYIQLLNKRGVLPLWEKTNIPYKQMVKNMKKFLGENNE